MMHIENNPRVTLCGLTVSDLPEDESTDAIYEMVEAPPDDACEECFKEAKEIVRQVNCEAKDVGREWDMEIAREEGMLNGIDSYNDWREFLG